MSYISFHTLSSPLNFLGRLTVLKLLIPCWCPWKLKLALFLYSEHLPPTPGITATAGVPVVCIHDLPSGLSIPFQKHVSQSVVILPESRILELETITFSPYLRKWLGFRILDTVSAFLGLCLSSQESVLTIWAARPFPMVSSASLPSLEADMAMAAF